MYLLSLPIYKDLANESISELKTMLFLPLTSPAVFSNKEYLLHIIRWGLQKIHGGRPPWFYPQNDNLSLEDFFFELSDNCWIIFTDTISFQDM